MEAQEGEEQREAGDQRDQDPVTVDIWARFDPSVLRDQPSAYIQENEKKERRKFQRTRRVLLNLVAGLLWSWVVIKLFLGDLDRWLVSELAPGLQWALDFRFFILLAVLATGAIVWRKQYLPGLLYILIWPLAVLVWHVPRFLYKRKSVAASVGAVHVVVAFVRGLRFTIVVSAGVLISALVIVLDSSPVLTAMACCILVCVWLVMLVRVILFAISPGRFVRGQHELVRKFLVTEWFANASQVPAALLHPDIKKYDKEQANQLLTQMSLALAITRSAQVWSMRLEEYRKSPATLFVACLAVLGIFLHGIATFAFVNLGIYNIQPSEYVALTDPTLATFLYYTFAAAATSEVAVLVPVGGLATTVNTVTGLSAGLILIVFVLTLAVGARQSGSDPQTDAAITVLRADADRLEHKIAENYGLDQDSLWQIINDMGGGILKLLPFLLRSRTGEGQRSSAQAPSAQEGGAEGPAA